MTFVLIQRHVDLGVSGMSLAPQIRWAWIKLNQTATRSADLHSHLRYAVGQRFHCSSLAAWN